MDCLRQNPPGRGSDGESASLCRRPNHINPGHSDRALLLISLACWDFAGGPFTRTVTEMFIRVMIVVGLYTFIGNSGVISFGHIGFMCIGRLCDSLVHDPAGDEEVLTAGIADSYCPKPAAASGLPAACDCFHRGHRLCLRPHPDAAQRYRRLHRHFRDARGHQHGLFQLAVGDGRDEFDCRHPDEDRPLDRVHGSVVRGRGCLHLRDLPLGSGAASDTRRRHRGRGLGRRRGARAIDRVRTQRDGHRPRRRALRPLPRSCEPRCLLHGI